MKKSVQSQYTIRWHTARRAEPKFNPVSFWLQSLLLCCCYWSVGKPCPTLQPHELKYARLPYPSLFPEVCSNSWCHPTISSSVTHFFSCSQSFCHQGLFQWVHSSQQVAKVLELWKYWKSHSGLIFFRTEPILLSFLKSLYWTCCNVVSVSFFFFWPWGIWYLNSPTWYQTHTTCIGRWSLNQQTAREVPILNFFLCMIFNYGGIESKCLST